jgi:hypothetical protein
MSEFTSLFSPSHIMGRDQLERRLIEALGGDPKDAWGPLDLDLMVGECDENETDAAVQEMSSEFDPDVVRERIGMHRHGHDLWVAQNLPVGYGMEEV